MSVSLCSDRRSLWVCGLCSEAKLSSLIPLEPGVPQNPCSAREGIQIWEQQLFAGGGVGEEKRLQRRLLHLRLFVLLSRTHQTVMMKVSCCFPLTHLLKAPSRPRAGPADVHPGRQLKPALGDKSNLGKPLHTSPRYQFDLPKAAAVPGRLWL